MTCFVDTSALLAVLDRDDGIADSASRKGLSFLGIGRKNLF